MAESELGTNDPTIDPETWSAFLADVDVDVTTAQEPQLFGPPQERANANPHTPLSQHDQVAGHPPNPGAGSESELLKVLKQLLRDKGAAESGAWPWPSIKGPAPGVRFRGGAPPQPPKWRYQSTDLCAVAKYEKRVRVLQMQVENCMSAAEAGLSLFTSLSGEAEAEAECMDLANCWN